MSNKRPESFRSEVEEKTPSVELTDGVVLLRPFTPEDAGRHLLGEDAPQVKWLSGGVSTLESVLSWINKNAEYWRNDGPVFNFAIKSISEKELVGMVEANTEERIPGLLQEGDANISYGLYPEARGKGFATRAVELVTEFLKSKGVRRAVIHVHPENEASLKVPERCGFRPSGSFESEGERWAVFVKDLSLKNE